LDVCGNDSNNEYQSFTTDDSAGDLNYLGAISAASPGLQRTAATAGHITKQGSSMMRFLLVEAAQVTVRSEPEWRSKYLHLMMRRGRKIAKGRDGPQAGGSSVLDDESGMGLRAVEKVRFARGTTRKSPWCAVDHRVIDWASRSSSVRSPK
jgi:hypothetical protein